MPRTFLERLTARQTTSPLQALFQRRGSNPEVRPRVVPRKFKTLSTLNVGRYTNNQ